MNELTLSLLIAAFVFIGPAFIDHLVKRHRLRSCAKGKHLMMPFFKCADFVAFKCTCGKHEFRRPITTGLIGCNYPTQDRGEV